MSSLIELTDSLKRKNERISKAKRVKALLLMQKRLLKKKRSLTDFNEPVLFLVRRDGKMDMFEKATAGKFVFDHSTGKPRFLELRPSDQITFDYGDRKVRGYIAHEDRPYAGWDDPVVDGETVMLGYEKTKATDLKYQQKMEELKQKGKLTWLWVIAGIIASIGFFIMVVPDKFWDRIFKSGASAVQNPEVVAGIIPLLTWKLKQIKRFPLVHLKGEQKQTFK